MEKIIQKRIIEILNLEAQTSEAVCEKVSSELNIAQNSVLSILYAMLRGKELQIIAGKYALAYRG